MLDMNLNDTTHKNQLDKLLAEVVTELESIATLNEQTGDWEVKLDLENHTESDEDIISDNSEAAEERIATLTVLETKYRHIQAALANIQTDSYGKCLICQKTIEEARLNIYPAARTCIAHKEDDKTLPI